MRAFLEVPLEPSSAVLGILRITAWPRCQNGVERRLRIWYCCGFGLSGAGQMQASLLRRLQAPNLQRTALYWIVYNAGIICLA
jgi:hypothetical protein